MKDCKMVPLAVSLMLFLSFMTAFWNFKVTLAAPIDPSHRWAVIIIGGPEVAPFENNARHIYVTLTNKCRFDPKNIYVLEWDDGKIDLDCDGTEEEYKPAKLENVRDVYKELKDKLDGRDLLFTFITAHGNHVKKVSDLPYDDDVECNLYGEDLSDQELHDLTKVIKAYKIFVLDLCYSGGFINEFEEEKHKNWPVQKNTVVCTSTTDYLEQKLEPDFSKYVYHFTSALRGCEPNGTGTEVCKDGKSVKADTNLDNKIQIKEAHEYAEKKVKDDARVKPLIWTDWAIDDKKASLEGPCTPDYGDAPNPFPTRNNDDGARHLTLYKEWLGDSVDAEDDAWDWDRFDDGLLGIEWTKGKEKVKLKVGTSGDLTRYSETKRLYVSGWFDWDPKDEKWEDKELVIEWSGGPGIGDWASEEKSKIITVKLKKVPKKIPFPFWARFRLNYSGPVKKPTGEAKFGEVEDYKIEKPVACMQSSDEKGAEQSYFTNLDHIYVSGSGFAHDKACPIYVVEDDWIDWDDGMKIPDRIPGTAEKVTTDATGAIAYSNLEASGTPPALLWDWGEPGKYDIVVDVDSDGFYNATVDPLDEAEEAGFVVTRIVYTVGGTIELVRKRNTLDGEIAPLGIYTHILATVITVVTVATLCKGKKGKSARHAKSNKKLA